MAFFNDTKNFGLVIAILGVVSLLLAIIGIVKNTFALSSVGQIITGLLYMFAGYIIYARKTPGALAYFFPEGNTSKYGVLVAYVFIVGISTIIEGIFFIPSWGSFAVNLILGLIIVAIGYVITDGKKTALDTIIWAILVLVFLVLIILAILAIIGSFGVEGWDMLMIIINVVTCVASLLAYLMAFLYLLDPEVKSKF